MLEIGPLTAMRALRAVALCFMAAATAHAENLSGHWCGVGEQTSADGTKSYWSANLTLDGAGGRMDYPSLDCGGTLTFERADGNIRSYRERIEYGRDKCLDDGLVRVERQGTSVRWEWTGSGIEARALLTPNCLESAPKTGAPSRQRLSPTRASREVRGVTIGERPAEDCQPARLWIASFGSRNSL